MLPENARLLVFGSANDRLEYLESKAPHGSVVVVDDPGVLTLKRFHEAAGRFRVVDEVIGADIYKSDDWMCDLEKAHAGRPFTAVIPGLEYPSVAAARFASRIGMPGAGIEAAQRMRNKAALMQCAESVGIACPHSTVVHNAAEIRVPTDTRRWVLKPIDRQASVGVQVLEADADVEAAWAVSTGSSERSYPRHLFTGACLVQPYLDGPEFSVECLVVEGEIVFRNVTEQVYASGQHAVQLGHIVPARIGGETHRALVTETQRLVAAAGFRTGVVHAEWIVQDGQPFIVDCAGRLPGDSLVELIDIAYGVDFEGALIRALIGLDVVLAQHPVRAAAISFFCPPVGTIVGLRGAERARAGEGVVSLDLPEVGTAVGTAADAWSRSGEVLVEAADSDEAVDRIVRTVQQLQVDIAADGSNHVIASAITPSSAWSAQRPAAR